MGEVANLYRAASGHFYFSLRDADGQVKAALFRNAARRLPFELEEGLEVTVYAEVTVYEARGDLQLIVREVEPRGRGAMQLAIEQLRRRLDAEGLFDEARKQPIPAWPRRVGIVTSPAGAALRDVIQVSGHRCPSLPLLLSPTRVQGDGSENEIVAALERVAEAPEIDLILLVRGGGSPEDLMAFNTEAVARAIAACPIPVVAGVGHETDFSIADAVADARAPTPSAAVTLALPDMARLLDRVTAAHERLTGATASQIRSLRRVVVRERDALRALAPSARVAAGRNRLRDLGRVLQRTIEAETRQRRTRIGRATTRLAAATPDVERSRLRLAGASQRMQRAALADGERRRGRVAALAAQLDSLSPLAVLARGYGLVRTPSGEIVRGSENVSAGDALRIRTARAEIEATATAVRDLPEDPD